MPSSAASSNLFVSGGDLVSDVSSDVERGQAAVEAWELAPPSRRTRAAVAAAAALAARLPLDEGITTAAGRHPLPSAPPPPPPPPPSPPPPKRRRIVLRRRRPPPVEEEEEEEEPPIEEPQVSIPSPSRMLVFVLTSSLVIRGPRW